MIVYRQISPRRVGLGVVAWAVGVGFLLFVASSVHHVGVSESMQTTAYLVAGLLTATLGLWLGWRHRTGTAFAAPVLAWVVWVPFAFATEFIQRGFFSGLWHGFLLASFGGFLIAFVEGLILVSFAILGRIAAAALHHDEGTTVILPPRAG
jgi:hypothetical protein